MTNEIVHLDCTFRDGGYYTNWDFSYELINSYLSAIEGTSVGYCEIGFRYLENNNFKGSCAFTTDEFLRSLDIPKDIKIAIMINSSDLFYNNKFSIQRLKRLVPVSANKSPVDLVRIAGSAHSIKQSMIAYEYLNSCGYMTGCNVTQVSDKSPDQIIELGSLVSGNTIDVLYIADSLGALKPAHIENIITNLRMNWSGPIGIHAHDNQGLALSNTLKAIEEGVTWVDSTITGIGRGPGNAKTEELMLEIANKKKKNINYVPLLKLINREFKPLKIKHAWGTNPYYYLAGKYSIHPSYIQSMLSDYRYQEEDILASIDYLKSQGVENKKFNFTNLDDTRKFYNAEPVGSWQPRNHFEGKDVLLLGTGEKLHSHIKAVESFIKRSNAIVIAMNTQTLINNQLIDFRIACHPTRLLADLKTHLELPQPLIIPLSMLPKEFSKLMKLKEVLDYGIGISQEGFEFFETYSLLPNSLVLAYALAIVSSGKASKIYLAGFDGYSTDDSRNDEVNDLLNKFKTARPDLELIAITPSKYKNLTIKSVYGI